MSLIDQVRAKKRNTYVAAILAVPLTLVLMLALGVLSISWAVVVGVFIYLRMMRTNKYVIWLRRFHRSEPKRFRFNMLLNNACNGLCVPITIQDTVFKTSYYSSFMRMSLIAPMIFGLGTLLYFLCAATIWFSLDALGVVDDGVIALGLLMALIPLGLYVYFVKKQLVSRGFTALTSRNATEEVGSRLNKIAYQKLGFPGVLIFKCPDNVWQQVVSLGMSRASAVIIDVSDLTENVLWELRMSLQTHPPESIILTFGVSENAREELPSTTRYKLEKIVNSDNLSRLRIFYYPAEQFPPGPSRARQYRELSQKFSIEIAACMEIP